MQTHISYRKKFFIKAMVYISICTSFGIISMYLLKSKNLTLVSIGLMIVPFLFITFLLKRYTKKMNINFYSDSFATSIIDGVENVSENTIYLRNIKSYSIQFPNDNFNSIKFKLRDGGNLEYSFFQKKKYDNDIESAELINSFHLLISNYNSTKINSDKVLFKPSFYGTRAGLYTIISLVAFLIFALLLYSVYGTKPLPLTFLFSLILIVHLAIRRKKDLDYYKKIDGSFSTI